MFNEVPETERDRRLIDAGLDVSRLKRIKLVHRVGNVVIRRHLESLPLETFDSVSSITCSFPLLLICLQRFELQIEVLNSSFSTESHV